MDMFIDSLGRAATSEGKLVLGSCACSCGEPCLGFSISFSFSAQSDAVSDGHGSGSIYYARGVKWWFESSSQPRTLSFSSASPSRPDGFSLSCDGAAVSYDDTTSLCQPRLSATQYNVVYDTETADNGSDGNLAAGFSTTLARASCDRAGSGSFVAYLQTKGRGNNFSAAIFGGSAVTETFSVEASLVARASTATRRATITLDYYTGLDSGWGNHRRQTSITSQRGEQITTGTFDVHKFSQNGKVGSYGNPYWDGEIMAVRCDFVLEEL